ncbi:EAL domain-containing protein [Lichenicoccus sp.]|uniref:EAL domain-containing protein n=1 Tax=Lichenicoccus sp. TaxID=2781899 RepID=UPI003D0DF24F
MGERTHASLLFQPRYQLADGGLVAIEAFALRPRTALHGAREPGRDLGRDEAMLRHAGRLIAHATLVSTPILSLRVTEAQAASGGLARLIADMLAETGLPPSRLELEFSEACLQTDEPELLYLLAALADLGVSAVLGGFGAHVSSLTLLRRRSLAGLLTGLKLHGLLVSDLDAGGADDAFLGGLVATAHALGLLVIAEGVACGSHETRLRDAGCDQALGPWLGGAQPALDAIRTWRLEQDRAS